jgi:signal transduction histidine kinase
MSSDTTGESRNLKVTTARDGGEGIIVWVEDSGPGIDPHMVDAIFEAFVTTKKNRLGLGLTVGRMIVERHAGRISASSSSRSGARLQVILPTAATAPAAPH